MVKKILILSFVSALALTFTHCTKKSEVEMVDGDGNKQVTSEEELKKSLDLADQEMGKMIDEVSQMGYKGQNEINSLIQKFERSDDKYEKAKLCGPIIMAHVNYGIRSHLNKEVPQLTNSQLKTIENAKQHCEWATTVFNDFEKTLSDDDWKSVAGNTPNSTIPFKKSLFSKDHQCQFEDYKKLLAIDATAYKDTKTLSSVLIVATIQEDGNLKDYIPRYKEVLLKKNPAEKEFMVKFLDESAKNLSTPRAMEQKKQSLEKALKAFNEIGIKDVPRFVMQSVSAAPGCFSSVDSNLIDIAKIVVTGDRLKAFYSRISEEVKSSGKVPASKAVAGSNILKEMDKNFAEELLTDKVAVRDKWFRPFMVSGDKNNFKVVSAGRDRKPGTKDDITYPGN